jgi:hypothetical protein
MTTWLYDTVFSFWHSRATVRAATDETWAEIEARRHAHGRKGTSLFLSQEHDLGWEEWETQRRIFDELNPRPWWLTAARLVDDTITLPARATREVRRSLQRVQRGYSDQDLWSFDTHLARVIAAGCRQLAEQANGHPGDITWEEWQEELRAIADGFDAAENLKWGDDPDEEELQAVRDRGFALFRDRFGDLWD